MRNYKFITRRDPKMAVLNGQALFSQALYGLQNTYSILAQNNKNGGLSIEDISNPSSSVLQQLGGNTSFAQFLSSNFASIDKDGDGKISSDDMSNLTSKLSQKGLSYQELCQLCSSGMGGSEMLNNVLTYFNQIDTNKDGRVTNAEIQAFNLKSDEERLKTEYKTFKSSSMSVFYGNEDADDTPSSLVDRLYPEKKS